MLAAGYSMLFLGVALLALVFPLLILTLFAPPLALIAVVLMYGGLAIMLAGIVLVAVFSSRRLYGKGYCPYCGYDMRSGHDRCPECGSAESGQD